MMANEFVSATTYNVAIEFSTLLVLSNTFRTSIFYTFSLYFEISNIKKLFEHVWGVKA